MRIDKEVYVDGIKKAFIGSCSEHKMTIADAQEILDRLKIDLVEQQLVNKPD